MADDGMVLGVDVGGTKIAVGAVQAAGARNRLEHPTRLNSTAELLDGLEATVNEVISAAGRPAAIGVGVPSQIEYTTGTVETSVNIPLTGVPLPLVAYGGTSRVATFIILALLVRLSAGPWDGSLRTRRKERADG